MFEQLVSKHAHYNPDKLSAIPGIEARFITGTVSNRVGLGLLH